MLFAGQTAAAAPLRPSGRCAWCVHPACGPSQNPTPPQTPPPSTTTGARCFGLRSALREGAVDLAAWHAAERPSVPPGELLTAACLGRSVFEGGAKGSSGDAPPLCVGVEWLRYDHAAFEAQRRQRQGQQWPAQGQQQQQQQQQEQQQPGFAVMSERADGGASASSSPSRTASATSSSTAPAAPRSSAAAGGWRDAAGAAAARAEAAARAYLGGDGDRDPLWFARRFAARAQTNLEAMRRMAAELAAAAGGRAPQERDGDY